MELIGYLGGILLALCALPEVYESYKRGYSKMNLLFLGLWSSGELLTLIYVYPTAKIPLIFNYSFNLLCLLVIIYYRTKPSTVKVTIEDDDDEYFIPKELEPVLIAHLEGMMEDESELMLELANNEKLSKLPVIKMKGFEYNGTLEFPDYGTWNFKGRAIFVEPGIKYTPEMLKKASIEE